MTNLTEKIIGEFYEFGFSIDHSVTRIREHSLSLDRCKRFTEIPRISFERNLTPLEWAIFAYYYSLAPNDHPSELSASTYLKIGRNTLAATLDSLSDKGLVFFDTHARTKLRIVNVSHPEYWRRNPADKVDGFWTDPTSHVPRSYSTLPERLNEAKDFAHAPGRHVRLPYLLFQTLIHPTSKFLYGLLCYLGVNTHPTTRQLAGILRCSAPTVARRIAELEEYRMIYSEAREPVNFGEHTRYFHHLTDVAFWKSRKAELWYPGGENSLIVRLDSTGFASGRNTHRLDETDAFRPHADATEFFARPEQSQETAQVRQVTTRVRQVMSQIRRDEVSSDAIQPENAENQQKMPQVRKLMPQIRQDVLRQVTSQRRQSRSQRRQSRSQRRQSRSQSTEKHASNPCIEPCSEDFAFAKNTFIRNTDNKNTDRKELRARERWTPVDRSFHPRLINIAQAAAVAWSERDYKCDRALWNGTVEQIAVERGQDEAVRFVSYVKAAYGAWGRPFPYSPQLMQDFMDCFRAGKSWASILGRGEEEVTKTEIPLEGENPDSSPGSENQVVDESKSLNRREAYPGQMNQLHADSDASRPGCSLSGFITPTVTAERLEPVTAEATPEPRPFVATADIPALEIEPESSDTPKKPRPAQLTHANLLDFPARSTAHQSLAAREMATEKNIAAEPSLRRIQLEKAISVLTCGMKGQSRDSLKRGFAKLDDGALLDNLCFLFGVERIKDLVPEQL